MTDIRPTYCRTRFLSRQKRSSSIHLEVNGHEPIKRFLNRPKFACCLKQHVTYLMASKINPKIRMNHPLRGDCTSNNNHFCKGRAISALVPIVLRPPFCSSLSLSTTSEQSFTCWPTPGLCVMTHNMKKKTKRPTFRSRPSGFQVIRHIFLTLFHFPPSARSTGSYISGSLHFLVVGEREFQRIWHHGHQTLDTRRPAFRPARWRLRASQLK